MPYEAFPSLNISGEQCFFLTAQLMIYQRYLQKKVAPSEQRNCTLRALFALLQRLEMLFDPHTSQGTLLLTTEEIALIKETLTILRKVLETRPPSSARDTQIQRLAMLQILIEQTFPLTQD